MAKITFKTKNGDVVAEAENGSTLLEVAEKAGVELYGGCGGAGVCGSCHVYIADGYVDKIAEASNEEQDLLDVISNGRFNSRLACQVVISDACDGMVVTIP